MSTMMHYTVILEREEDGGYHAFTPALKGCHSQGESVGEGRLKDLSHESVVPPGLDHAHSASPAVPAGPNSCCPSGTEKGTLFLFSESAALGWIGRRVWDECQSGDWRSRRDD